MARKRYSSDLQERDWQHIAPLINIARTGKWSLLEVVNAILYWLKNDCTWQDLPGDFPPWSTVAYYFRKWSEDGTWKGIDAYLTNYYGERAPYRKRKKNAPARVIVDLGWIKNKANTAPLVRGAVAAMPCFCGSNIPRARNSNSINMQGPPTYPETSEMGYALWLRHFAAKLPFHASRYGLTEIDVAEAKDSALEFIELLTKQVGRATQAIQQRYATNCLTSEEETVTSSARILLLQQVARLVQAIRAHRHYRIADGVDLKLNLAPNCPAFGVLPTPPLYVVGCLALDEKFAVALRWTEYPEAVVDLEVCRDSSSWQRLQLLAGKSYADIHPQPVEPMQWQYRARYQRPDWPPGVWGDAITVEVTHCIANTRTQSEAVKSPQ